MIIYSQIKSKTKEKEIQKMKSAKSLAGVHTSSLQKIKIDIKINKKMKDRNINLVSISDTG